MTSFAVRSSSGSARRRSPGSSKPSRRTTAQATVDRAWELGVRYFDTAPLYGSGLAEERLGEALAARPRDEYTVSTKVGRILVPGQPSPHFIGAPPLEAVFDFSPTASAARSPRASSGSGSTASTSRSSTTPRSTWTRRAAPLDAVRELAHGSASARTSSRRR